MVELQGKACGLSSFGSEQNGSQGSRRVAQLSRKIKQNFTIESPGQKPYIDPQIDRKVDPD